MPSQPKLLDIAGLKTMAAEAHKIRLSMPPESPWRSAYLHIEMGSGLLWRLLDQAAIDWDKQHPDKAP